MSWPLPISPAQDGLERSETRETWLNGVKAAFVIEQHNQLGLVLCARCGSAWSDPQEAFVELELDRSFPNGPGYESGTQWGIDHPNNLMLVCSACQKETAEA